MINDLQDPRIAPFLNLRNQNPTRFCGKFIVESKLLVQRLVDSDYVVDSILIDPRVGLIPESWIERQIPIYQVPDTSDVIGFHFHRGALACGIRKQALATDDLLNTLRVDSFLGLKSVYLHRVQDPENMGSIFRCCAALGVSNVIIGPACVDPYARRVIRVSMGTAFKLNLYEDQRTEDFLQAAKSAEVASFAATLGEDAVELPQVRPTRRWLLMFGNEAHGIPVEVAQACTERVRIKMHDGVNSLNVSNAAAIFLYAFTA